MAQESILRNATDAELGLAVFENLYALFRAMAKNLPEGQLFESETLSRHLTFPTNPMFKGVWKTRLFADEADAYIDEAITWFKEQGAPYFFWWTGGDSSPGDLEARLAKRGMISMAEQTQELAKGILSTEQGSPCMVAELARMNESVLTQTPRDFLIKEIADESGFMISKGCLWKLMRFPNGQDRPGWMRPSRSGSGKRPGDCLLAT